MKALGAESNVWSSGQTVCLFDAATISGEDYATVSPESSGLFPR